MTHSSSLEFNHPPYTSPPLVSNLTHSPSTPTHTHTHTRTHAPAPTVRMYSSTQSFRSRLQIIYTLPHLIALISLSLLALFIALSLYTESDETFSTPSRIAFLYLAHTQTSIQNLAHSLQTLNQHAARMQYPIFILHTNLTPVSKGKLQSLSEAQLTFRHFHIIQHEKSNATLTLNQLSMRAISRFWFQAILLKTSIFSHFDYIIRLDPHAAFVADIRTDFMQTFIAKGLQYAYATKTHTCNGNATSVRALATSYVELNGISPRAAQLWSAMIRGVCVPAFGGAFEIMNLRFFRSHSGIRDWIGLVDTNGGIWREGWTDDVLRYVTVALYAAPDKVVRYDLDVVPYRRDEK